MNVILLIACIGMITGFFIILSLSPMEFTDSVFINILNKPRSIKEEINEITKRKKVSYFRREVIEVQSILKLTGREGWFPMICAVSLFLFAIGSGIAIVLGNFFSVPVLGIGFMLLPFWYVRLTQTHFKRDIAAELETALSIITTAYLRNEDIVTAVEENIDYLNPPVLSVFKGFVNRIKMINPDIAAGLEDMKVQLENKQRKMMEIMECEILPDGSRNYRALFQYIITENRMDEQGKFIIEGTHKQEYSISESLSKRLLENGMPIEMINRMKRREVT